MGEIVIEVIESLDRQVNDLSSSDSKIRKLFNKQRRFMSLNPHYSSLGRKKLQNVFDQYGNQLEEIRLNRYWRIVFIVRDEGQRVVWLKLCDHDEIARNNRLFIDGHPEGPPAI
ncbi:hypothetical protein JW899_00745 [Candidatus Uhrbacteria bacterium]|nr:hypothetical protein [Candidatus Uhrbacteria bacterium]